MTIDSRNYINSNRGLWSEFNGREEDSSDDYPKALGFEGRESFLQWLEGNVILDLGSGFNKLAQDVELEKKRGTLSKETRVIGVNISLSDPEFIATYNQVQAKHPIAQDNIKTISVAARWDKLPFPDKSFKRIISHYAFPLYAKSQKELVDTIRELKRVLDDEGEIRFQDCGNFSFQGTDIPKSGSEFHDYFLDLLQKEGFKPAKIQAGSMAGKMGVEMALSITKA